MHKSFIPSRGLTKEATKEELMFKVSMIVLLMLMLMV